MRKDEVILKIQRRNKLLLRYQSIQSRIDKVVYSLYRPELFTGKEYDALANEYQNLMIENGIIERDIRLEFGTKDIDELLNQFKKENYGKN